MRTSSIFSLAAAIAFLVAGCSPDGTSPSGPSDQFRPTVDIGSRAHKTPDDGNDDDDDDPDTPEFNLNVALRGEGRGFIRFRQPDDGAKIVYLRVRVRHLGPNTDYLLQRAVDTSVDDECTSTDWLTLGRGLVPQAITTNRHGKGRARLFRDLSAVPDGSQFDIHFRVINAASSAVVLESGCYQFAVNPR
jgi:hypothetical protein